MKVVTAPLEVLTLNEVADHLRIGGSPYPDAALLGSLITTARQHVEDYTRRALGTQTLSDFFPSFAAIRFRPPVQSITTVHYVSGGVVTLLPATDYALMDDDDKGGFRAAYGVTLPTPDAVPDAVRIVYEAGYTTGSPDNLPAPIRAAMLLIITDLYENRDAQIVGTSVMANPTVARLLSMYRLEMGI